MQLSKEYRQTRFEGDFKYIVDSEGTRVKFNDPRVVHDILLDIGYFTEFLESIYIKRKMKYRRGRTTCNEMLQAAKELCSGRECIMFRLLMGALVLALRAGRGEDEITVYYSMEAMSPCQVGGWPVIYDVFCRRLNLRNAVFPGHVSSENNYLGKGDFFGMDMMVCLVLGDIFNEAEATVKCLARDRESGLKLFREESRRVVESAKKGVLSIRSALLKWAKNVAKIPLRARVEDTPRVLIFGILSSFFHQSISDYFVEHGIIPKIAELTDLVLHPETYRMKQFGHKNGRNKIAQQAKLLPLLMSWCDWKNSGKEIYAAYKSMSVLMAHTCLHRYFRKIAAKSGIVWDIFIPYEDLITEGNHYYCENCDVDTTEILGRYVVSNRADGVFDGMIHTGAFSCGVSTMAQTGIWPLAKQYNLPFAYLDFESTEISIDQLKLLEAVAVRAKRLRSDKARGSYVN